MNVPSYEFLGFAALVALVINISPAPGWRRAVFLIANLAFVFLFTHDPVQLAPFAAFLALGFASMKLMEVYRRKSAFIALVAALVLAFCWLKHYTFVPQALFLPFVYFTVGMSYVFFRVMHLVVDAFQEALPARVGPLSYLNYTLNFTSLVSGPIQLYRDYIRSESERLLPLDRPVVGEALNRIITGLFKVSIVSPVLFYVHGRCVASLSTEPSLEGRVLAAVLMVAVFPVYLYFNFSGYTDFVIGVGRFLRLQLPENFNKPFTSEGFIDFWGRWHITLANWVKTYVYSPLLIGLMRRFPSRTIEPLLGVFAYFVAFFLVGVWHGQTTMFVFLGVLLGLGVSVNKLYQILMTRKLGRSAYRALCAQPVYAATSRGVTFAYFAFSSLWFWSTWDQLGRFAARLEPAGVTLTILLVVAGATVLLSALKSVDEGLRSLRIAGVSLSASRYVRTAWYAALVVIVFSGTVVLNAPAPHVVYKAF